MVMIILAVVVVVLVVIAATLIVATTSETNATRKQGTHPKQYTRRNRLIPSFLFRKFFPYLLMRHDAARSSHCLRSRTVARCVRCPSPKLLVALRATYSRVMQQFYGKRTYPSPNTRITQKWFAAKIIGTLAIRGTAALRCMPPRARAKDKAFIATTTCTL